MAFKVRLLLGARRLVLQPPRFSKGASTVASAPKAPSSGSGMAAYILRTGLRGMRGVCAPAARSKDLWCVVLLHVAAPVPLQMDLRHRHRWRRLDSLRARHLPLRQFTVTHWTGRASFTGAGLARASWQHSAAVVVVVVVVLVVILVVVDSSSIRRWRSCRRNISGSK